MIDRSPVQPSLGFTDFHKPFRESYLSYRSGSSRDAAILNTVRSRGPVVQSGMSGGASEAVSTDAAFASLRERDAEAAGSNPARSTIEKKVGLSENLMLLRLGLEPLGSNHSRV